MYNNHSRHNTPIYELLASSSACWRYRHTTTNIPILPVDVTDVEAIFSKYAIRYAIGASVSAVTNVLSENYM